MSEYNLMDEIKELINLTSRIDEKVKNVADSQLQMNQRLNHFIDEHTSLSAKVQLLESKMENRLHDVTSNFDEKFLKIISRLEVLESVGSVRQQKLIEDVTASFHEIKDRLKELESHKKSVTDRIKQVFGYVWQGVYMIIIAYLLYKLHLNPPLP